MATAYWRKGYSVGQLFQEVGMSWSFYQLTRLLVGVGVQEDDLLDELEHKICFTGSLSRNFPPGEIRSVSPVESKEMIQDDYEITQTAKKHIVECSYYNIYGLDGPLPEPFSDMMTDDIYYGRGAMIAFINIFNNRVQALRYLIHAKANYTLANSDASHSHIGQFLLALSGNYLHQQHFLSGQHEGDLISLAGHIANCRINFPTICQLFKAVLDLGVLDMQSLIGRWLNIQQEDLTLLGKSNHRLGGQATLGKKIWDQQAAFGLVLGPVRHSRLAQLVPGGKDFPKLKQLITWVAEKRCDCLITIECTPEVKADDNATFLDKARCVTNRLGYGAALKSDLPQTKRVQFMLNIV